jgi:hypothetical protein
MRLETQKVVRRAKPTRHRANRIKCEGNITPRGLTRNEAADVAGVSVSSFDKARKEGKFPGPTLPGKRYDLVLLHAAMDRLSGISTSGDALSPLEMWRASHGAHSPSGH